VKEKRAKYLRAYLQKASRPALLPADGVPSL
jgi:hypothetical protein